MEALKRIEEDYEEQCENDMDEDNLDKWKKFCADRGIIGWEGFFCPDEDLYDFVLTNLEPDDVVFDVGAGDLRLDLMMSQKVRKVYAVEINPKVLSRALTVIEYDLPPNVIAICGNGFEVEIPSDVTVVVMIMRHNQHKVPLEKWVKASDFKLRRLIITEEGFLRIYNGFVCFIEKDLKDLVLDGVLFTF